MGKNPKTYDPYRMTPLQMAGWSGRAVSLAANVIVTMQITFYCTNILAMDPILVGTLLLASKIFDGVTDLFAGVLIDKTHTKWGKARPYEFAILGVWVSTILMFSCPDMGTAGKSAWIFITYTLVNSIFATLLNSSEAVYLVRAFKYENDRNKLISVNGLVVTLGCTALSMIFPILMGSMGQTKGGWTLMVTICAVPLMLIGLGRFLFVKEINNDVVDTASQKLGMKDFLPALKNKYVWIIVAITLLVNLITNANSSVGSYFFTYIVGDINKMGLVSMLGLVSPLFLLVMPKLLSKFSVSKIFSISFILGAVGAVIRGIAGANMALIMIGSLVGTLANLAPSYFTLILIIGIMDYHEWKTGDRVEGVISSINGFAAKLAGGLASGGVGLIMGLCGFDGQAEVITDAAMASISALYCWIPAVMFIGLVFLMRLFDLEKKLPQIRAELAERHAAQFK